MTTKINYNSHLNKRRVSSGKRYLVLIEVKDVYEVEPFPIDKSGYGNMDDWLPVEDIDRVMIR